MEAIVMYPSPGIGHLISMVELGKLILSHCPSYSIVILTTTPPFNTGSTAPYIRHVSATTPPISFHHLPPISPPLDPFSFPSIEAVTFELLRLNTPNVRQALRSISLSASVAAFIIDLFSTPAFSVGAELNLPTFYFFTSGASCLACYLYLPTTDRNTTGDFKDMNTLLHFPSLPPIPSSDMPLPMMERRSVEYNALIDFFVHMPKSDGIIVNTFESLEPDAVKAIQDGLCVPDAPTPPVFCVGPLIASDEGRGGVSENVCLRWLDSQPSGSVVFLCFGSLGSFSVEQLAAMAVGLERSGQRFLWVVRNPPDPDKGKVIAAPPEPDLDSLLPDGFLERTKERGLVVKSWAPQVAVLRHDSVGGFVTHCGWNSVLEAVCAGVPMVAWPLYAEQRLNRVLLVEQMKLALSMNESDGGFVAAAEVEERVRELMESEAGKAARERAKAAKEGSMAALSDGGSSLAALTKLVESWKRS
ncbi:anthocyanidin 5,3-O-glucosyltransferase-like [Diospyros lotus]|uniref:anthocyanidin 5,3-O-glucosyltransferase-like n=1 Tax=Diospyros lotus TaxID=55363 RepID=UPI0022560403|nr:anthocyanidin 5,3-O-glucosyltransferase-like [Diospyros lotus]